MTYMPLGTRRDEEWFASNRARVGYGPLNAARLFADNQSLSEPEFRLLSLKYSRGIVPHAFQSLTSEEQGRARRFVRRDDRERFVLGRVVARSMLEEIYGLHRPTTEFEISANGKPFLRSRPDIAFNIAHSGDLVLVGMGRGLQLGVDVEQHRSGIDFDAIGDLAFARQEIEGVSFVAGEKFFFRQWCLKEAVSKALGTGFGADPRRFAIDTNALPPVTFVGKGLDDVGEGWTIAEFDVGDGYSAAAAWRSIHYGEVEATKERRFMVNAFLSD